jgi:hypothetical protein
MSGEVEGPEVPPGDGLPMPRHREAQGVVPRVIPRPSGDFRFQFLSFGG